MFFVLAALLHSRLASATEEELLKAIRAEGDMQCLGELYRRFGHLAYGVCLKYLKDRELAQDAVMEVWEKLAVELRKREVEKFSAWLHVLTRNHCLMQLRAAKSKATDSFSEINGHVVESAMVEHPTSEEGDQLENKLQQLEAAIASLPDEQKSCIKLFFLEKKSYQQVAELTGYDLKKVKSYIQNGKRNLKNALQRHHEEG